MKIEEVIDRLELMKCSTSRKNMIEALDYAINIIKAYEGNELFHKALVEERKDNESLLKERDELKEELSRCIKSEMLLSDEYMKIRTVLNAFDTNKGGRNRFEVTLKKLTDMKEDLDRIKGKWINIDDELPENREMVLIFTPECLTTQAYFSGTSFHVPWGDEYPLSKQPRWWMPLPKPALINEKKET